MSTTSKPTQTSISIQELKDAHVELQAAIAEYQRLVDEFGVRTAAARKRVHDARSDVDRITDLLAPGKTRREIRRVVTSDNGDDDILE